MLAPPPPLPTVEELGDQKELPAGQKEGLVSMCANPGLRSSERPGKLQGGEAKAVLQLSSLASTPPQEEEGGRPSELAAEKRLSLSFLPFGTSISLSLRFSCSDTSHGH